MSRTSCLAVLIAALASAAAPCATAGVVTLDFDSVAANAGNGIAYLNSHGITLTNVTPTSSAGVVDIRNYSAGSHWVNDNFLQQDGGGAVPCSFTLNFSTPLLSFSSARIATPFDLTTEPQWSATAYVGATPVGTVGESLDTWGNSPAKPFTLSGSGITSVIISANGSGFTGIGSVPLDDFVLTTVPEPSTIALAALGLISLGFVVLRK
jgi:PEP-CTERM motif-containing protein